MAKTSKAQRIGVVEAVKRVNKALKREMSTPPKPYRPAKAKSQSKSPAKGRAAKS
jgi:hypothetical protein